MFFSFLQYLTESTEFKYNGHIYKEFFGKYKCDDEYISRHDYLMASFAYKAYIAKNGRQKLREHPLPPVTKRETKPVEKPKKSTTKTTVEKPVDTKKTVKKTTTKKTATLKKSVKKSFKTLVEAESFIENLTGVFCTFKGINISVASGLTESIEKLYGKYPKMFKKMKMISSVRDISIVRKKALEEIAKNKELQKELKKFIAEKSKKIGKVGDTVSDCLYNAGMNAQKISAFCRSHKVNMYDDIDKKTLDIIKANAESYITDYFIERKFFPVGGHIKSNTYAFYVKPEEEKIDVYSGIYLMPRLMNDSKKSYEDNVKIKGHPAGTDYRSIMTHEFGHLVDRVLKLAYHNQEITDLFLKLSKKEITQNVSKYANTDVKEFIAECFSEYNDSDSPRPIAMKVGQIIDKLYKEMK